MFSYRNISSYHQYLSQNDQGCETAVRYYLNNISAQQHLNAFVEVYHEEAIKRAQELDKKRKQQKKIGKLHGVIIAIKDVICYKDHTVTAASSILKGFVSMYNASAIQYLLDEEAIIIGNCNCDEFAMGSSNENSVYGNVLNAFDTTKVPGGSSGGSAVAVQANMCMISLGSDTGGSVRQPADFCGIIGLKPSYGSISRYGLIAYASSFDQIGIFGKSIEDVSIVLEVISKPDSYDSTMNPTHHLSGISNEISQINNKKYKIAVLKDVMQHHSLDNEIKSGVEATIQQLAKQGHICKEVDFDLLNFIVPTYYILTAAEASSNLSRFDGVRFGHQTSTSISDIQDFYTKNRTEGFGKEVKRRIMLGNFVLSSGYYDAYYTKAQQVRRLLVDKMNLLFKEFDAIILPTSPTTAFKIGDKQKDPISMYLADIFTVFANLTGVPAIALPRYTHSNGMPFGVQLLTKINDEKNLLGLSRIILNEL